MHIPGLPNFRDLGGHRTSHGTVMKAGMLYRSVDLSRLEPEGGRMLADLGVRRVYDLRTAGEVGKRPDRTPDGMTRVELDVLADAKNATAAQMARLTDDPRRVTEVLGGGRAVEQMTQTYRSLVTLPSAGRGYRKLFLGLADGAADGGALFHCTTGKDRTGWAAASLMLLLGVDEDAVMADYLRTNDDLLPALQPVLDRFAADGGDPEILRPLLGVREEYLRTALDEVDNQFGDVRAYVTDGLGLSETDITQLAETLTRG